MSFPPLWKHKQTIFFSYLQVTDPHIPVNFKKGLFILQPYRNKEEEGEEEEGTWGLAELRLLAASAHRDPVKADKNSCC